MAETADAESPETGPGRMLQDGRKRQGLSKQDAAAALNLRQGIIEALESDRYELLPPRTFVKGYLRTYAKLVGIDEVSVLAAFEKQQPESSAERMQLTTPRAGTVAVGAWLKWLVLLIVLSLLAYAAYDAYLTESPDPIAADAARQTDAATDVFASSEQESLQAAPESENNYIADTDSVTEPEATEADPVAVEPEADIEDLNETVTPPLAEPPLVEEELPAEPVAVETGVLTISVADESWVEVTDANGTKLHGGLVHGPRILKVSGTPPYRLVIGNADKVELQYDGEPVALQPHIRRNVARFTVP